MKEHTQLVKLVRYRNNCAGNDNRKCVRHLERVHTLGQVFEEEEVINGLQLITPWVVEHQHQERGHSG